MLKITWKILLMKNLYKTYQIHEEGLDEEARIAHNNVVIEN